MSKLTVVISAFNEEKKIGECLASVKEWADEIVVVDNSSIDRTAVIAKKYTKKVYKQKNDPSKIDLQKNYGFSKAKGDWILSLDADERVSEALGFQIRSVIDADDKEFSGYWIPRKNVIFGKWIEHTGWYPDFQLRLFRRTKGSYVAEHVHEDLKLTGKTDKLTEPLLHENYETFSQFISKHMIYASNEADFLLQKGYMVNPLDILRMPAKEFMSRYFMREGYKDGLHGLILSVLMAFYHVMIYVNAWEKKGFSEIQDEAMIESVEGEVTHIYKELGYWFLTEKMKRSGHVKGLFIQIKRKLM